MKKYGMFIDIDKCNGCYSCFLACRDEYCGNDYPPLSAAQPHNGQFWINVREVERGSYPKVKVDYIPIICQHCSNAPCVKASPNNAVYRRKDGIVIIDPEKAKGQKEIVSACPHRVIYWNKDKNIPQKCTFCAHLLDDGEKVPRCVEACPTGALVFGDLNKSSCPVSKNLDQKDVEKLHPEFNLDTSVFYTNLPRRFISGEIVMGDKKDECAQNVNVTLIREKEETVTSTDSFGDFEFNDLDTETEYTLKIDHPGYAATYINVKTMKDINLQAIVLEPV